MIRDFCSQQFASSVKELYGTVPVIDRLLLIEYPQPWNDEPITDNKLPDAVNRFLQNCIDTGIFSRIFFIKNATSKQGVIRLYAINNRTMDPFTRMKIIGDYEELLIMDIPAFFSEDLEKGEIVDHQLYLVCTNGKVDKCCSKFGLPIYKQLLSMDENVWQCTHITGCRLAPNVVSVPYLHYYGHLVPEEVPELYRCMVNQQIYLKKYRGRTCYSPAEQAAEYFLREALGDVEYQSMFFLDSSSEDDLFTVRFKLGKENLIHEVYLTAKTSERKYIMNCNNVLKPINVFKLVAIENTNIS